jgi:hypothetical protein
MTAPSSAGAGAAVLKLKFGGFAIIKARFLSTGFAGEADALGNQGTKAIDVMTPNGPAMTLIRRALRADDDKPSEDTCNDSSLGLPEAVPEVDDEETGSPPAEKEELESEL